MDHYSPEHSCGTVKVELDLSNYATKTYLKGATGIDTSKADLAILKTKVDNLDTDKIKADPADLSRLSNIVDYNIARKACVR